MTTRWYAPGVMVILALLAGAASAQSISLVGIYGGGSKAVLIIGEKPPRTMIPGESAGGVKLLSIDREGATIEMAGQVRHLALGDHRHVAATNDSRSVTLVADGRGHFSVAGAINGESVSFLVDTGASAVTLDAATARRIGLNLESAQPGFAGTANGTVPTLYVKLDRVSIGDVTMRDVDAVVVPASLSQVLLGASFLNRMAMHREGSTMVLTQRY